MFEIKIDLGQVAANLSEEKAHQFGFERTFYPREKHARIVREALAQQGHNNTNQYLLRGGFRSKEDFDLLINKGTDYFGRSKSGSPCRYSSN